MELELVVVKDVNGRALVRWMVGTVGRVAKITNDAGAESARAGREPEFMVGFPLSDIYEMPLNARISDGQMPEWADFTARF